MIDQMFSDISDELKRTSCRIDCLVGRHDVSKDELYDLIAKTNDCLMALKNLTSSFDGVIVTGFMPVDKGKNREA